MQADFRTKWKLLCLFSRLNIFYASEQRSVFYLRYLLFCVLWYDVMNKQTTEKMILRQSRDVTVLYLDFFALPNVILLYGV